MGTTTATKPQQSTTRFESCPYSMCCNTNITFCHCELSLEIVTPPSCVFRVHFITDMALLYSLWRDYWPPALSLLRKKKTASQWASCQIRKIAGCAYTGNAGNVSTPPRFCDPDMHHGMCVTHVPWCIPGSLTNGFPLKSVAGSPRNSWRMRNLRFYVSGKRPMITIKTAISLSSECGHFLCCSKE